MEKNLVIGKLKTNKNETRNNATLFLCLLIYVEITKRGCEENN